MTGLGVDAHGFIDLDALRARDHRSHDPRHASWPRTTRSARSSRSPRSARSRTSTARSSTPTRRRRPARSRSTSRDGHRPALADRAQVLRPEGRAARCSCGGGSRSSPLACQIDGGGQENGLRSGTLNVPGIVGLGAAAEICRLEMPAESARLAALRDRLLDGLRGATRRRARQRPARRHRLPHNLHVSFDGVEGEALLMALGDLAVSTGSACSSGSQAPSHVLKAIGAARDAPAPSIRFGLGRTTTAATSTSPSTASRPSSRRCVHTARLEDVRHTHHRRAQSGLRRRVHVLRAGERPASTPAASSSIRCCRTSRR